MLFQSTLVRALGSSIGRPCSPELLGDSRRNPPSPYENSGPNQYRAIKRVKIITHSIGCQGIQPPGQSDSKARERIKKIRRWGGEAKGERGGPGHRSGPGGSHSGGGTGNTGDRPLIPPQRQRGQPSLGRSARGDSATLPQWPTFSTPGHIDNRFSEIIIIGIIQPRRQAQRDT